MGKLSKHVDLLSKRSLYRPFLAKAGWPTPHLFGFFRFFLKLQNFRGTDLKLLIFRAYLIKITESTTDSVIF